MDELEWLSDHSKFEKIFRYTVGSFVAFLIPALVLYAIGNYIYTYTSYHPSYTDYSNYCVTSPAYSYNTNEC